MEVLAARLIREDARPFYPECLQRVDLPREVLIACRNARVPIRYLLRSNFPLRRGTLCHMPSLLA